MAPPPLVVARGKRTLRVGPLYPSVRESEYKSKTGVGPTVLGGVVEGIALAAHHTLRFNVGVSRLVSDSLSGPIRAYLCDSLALTRL
jgi:hypothetical protein